MLRLAVPTLALALLAPPADAGLIVTKMDTNTPIMTFTIPSHDMYGESGYVGPNSVSLNAGPFAQEYCTDLFRSIGVDDRYPASIQPLSSLPGGAQLARLFAADAATDDSSQVDKAALQLAVWDVVESARAGLSPLKPLPVGIVSSTEYKVAGVVDITSNSVNMATVMDRVSSLLTSAPSFAPANLTYTGTDTGYGQGFVGLTAVPEPATFISAGTGLISLLLIRLRRRSGRG